MSVGAVQRSTGRRSAISLEARAACPSCEQPSRDVVWRARFSDEPVRSWIDRHCYAGDPVAELGDARFELARCHGCRLLYHARVLSAPGLDRLYSTWIDAQQIERFEAQSAGVRRHQARFDEGRQIVKHLLRLHHAAGTPWPFRVLDFGCGDGRLLRAARTFGFEAWGVDPSATREARAGHEGLEVRRSLEEVALEGPGTFDAVVLMQVLEHLVAPREVLQSLARVMRSGSVLLVEVPDARGIDGEPRSFDQFRTVHPLEHVNAFTPETLEGICRRAGFQPIRRAPVHATASLRDVLKTEASRFVSVPSTSQYFVKI